MIMRRFPASISRSVVVLATLFAQSAVTAAQPNRVEASPSEIHPLRHPGKRIQESKLRTLRGQVNCRAKLIGCSTTPAPAGATGRILGR